MKKADMRKAMDAGTVVAVGRRPTKDTLPTDAKPATIVGLNAKRRVHSGARWDIGGHIAEDGVRVRYDTEVTGYTLGGQPILVARSSWARGDDHEETDDRVVAPKDVIMPWDEYEVKLAEQVARRDSRESARRDAETQSRELAAALTELGFAADPYYYRDYLTRGHVPGEYRGVIISIAQAAKLVEQLKLG